MPPVDRRRRGQGRRGGRQPRWWLLALIVSVVVLAVNTVRSGGSSDQDTRSATLRYLDAIRPGIEASTAQGLDLDQMRGDPGLLGRDGIGRRTERLVAGARTILRQLRSAEPPPTLEVSHSVLVATMAVRARATVAIRSTLDGIRGEGSAAPAVDALVASGQDLAAADRTYKVFAESVQDEARAAPGVPASRWLGAIHLWDEPEVAAFVGSLRSATSATPLHNLSVVAVASDPAAVGREGAALVLPLVRSLRLEIVVANSGNSAQRQVPVVATLQGPGGELDTARQFVDLEPGQRLALSLGGLRPVQAGGPSTVTVAVGPAEGEGDLADNQRTLSLVLRG